MNLLIDIQNIFKPFMACPQICGNSNSLILFVIVVTAVKVCGG